MIHTRRYVNKAKYAPRMTDSLKPYGYTVEKEKLYTVEIPNPALNNLEFVIVLKRIRGRVCLVNTYDYMGRELSDEYKLTEAEIKQDFEWAFQFAKPVEEK